MNWPWRWRRRRSAISKRRSLDKLSPSPLLILTSPFMGEVARSAGGGSQRGAADFPHPTALRSADLPDEGGGKKEEQDIAYPVAAALACKAMGIEKSHALLAFLQGFANALVSVAVRLVPLGQTQGLEVIRNLMTAIADTAKRAEASTFDDLGSIAIASDIAAMKHETQYSRVFRT